MKFLLQMQYPQIPGAASVNGICKLFFFATRARPLLQGVT